MVGDYDSCAGTNYLSGKETMRWKTQFALLVFVAVSLMAAGRSLAQEGDQGRHRHSHSSSGSDRSGPEMGPMMGGDRHPDFRRPKDDPDFRRPKDGPEFRRPEGGLEMRGPWAPGGPPMGGPPMLGPMSSGGPPWAGRPDDRDRKRFYLSSPASYAPSSSGSSSDRHDSHGGGSSSSDRLASFLSMMDANRDGMLSLNEIPESRRGFVQSMLQRAGLNITGPISINSIRDALTRAHGGNSSGSSDGKDKKASTEPPLVPGFGEPVVLAPVPGFGTRDTSGPKLLPASSMKTSSSKGSRGPTSSSSSSSNQGRMDPQTEERLKGFAQMLMQRYDQNRDGRLTKDEWGQLRGDPKEYDANHDGAITLDEMTAHLAQYSRSKSGRSDSHSGPSDSRHGSPSSQTPQENQKKSYRFLTVSERLPKGLPEWFTRQDANGDGQVTMAEYTSVWTEEKAQEFARLDLNNDGLITPQECLKSNGSGGTPMQLASQERSFSPERSSSSYWSRDRSSRDHSRSEDRSPDPSVGGNGDGDGPPPRTSSFWSSRLGGRSR
jgi:hypothetical protein